MYYINDITCTSYENVMSRALDNTTVYTEQPMVQRKYYFGVIARSELGNGSVGACCQTGVNNNLVL